MYKYLTFITVSIMGSTSQAVSAAESLEELIVTGAQGATKGPYLQSQLNQQGVALLGGPAQTSPYRLLELMPSVNAESADAYGLSTTRNLNIRGKGDFHVTRNVENIPLEGINGGGDLFDLENVAAFDLYRSAVPANVAFGISSTTGAFNMTLRRPDEHFSVELRQGLGSDEFQRTFVRMDTGRLGSAGPSLFVSASDSAVDKWKGVGQTDRRNVSIGVLQQFGNGGKFELFAVKNELEAHNYRSMSYAQSQDSSLWDNFDYDATLNPAQRSQYFDFNRQSWDDTGVIANLVVPLGANGTLTLRTHYWDNAGYRLFANGASVRLWENDDHKQIGALVQYDAELSDDIELSAGYWGMNMDSAPPPVHQQNFSVDANGGLNFTGWAVLSKQSEHEFRSPFAQLTARLGSATTVSGGVRYAQQRVPSLLYYNTNGLPNVPYHEVWAFNPELDPMRQVASEKFTEALPNISLHRELNGNLALTMAYGRRAGRPDWGPVANAYLNNRAAFVAQGVSLADVFGNLQPELSDNFDLGMRFESDRLSLAPNVYYARTRNKEVTLFDPAVAISYPQSSTKAIAGGVELEGIYRLTSSLSTNFSLSYNRYAFDGDVQVSAGTTAAVDGKQVPNSARVLTKLGVDYRRANWNLSPVLRYVGKRYGDTFNTQKVDSYLLADLHMGYQWKNVAALREINLNLSVLNLFDKNYISVITPNDLDLGGATGYYAGAPRTIAATASIKFQ